LWGEVESFVMHSDSQHELLQYLNCLIIFTMQSPIAFIILDTLLIIK